MSADVIDWELAAGVGRRLTPRGPELPPEQAHDAVAELRDLARFAVGPVRECTGLVADDTDAITVVVDRDAWVASNIAGFRVLLEPLLDRMRERRDGAVATVGSRVTAVQLGGVLAFLSGKVLGQYEVFTRADGTAGPAAARRPQHRRRPSASSASTRTTSGSGCACTRRRTGCSSVRCPWLRDHIVAQIQAFLAAAESAAARASCDRGRRPGRRARCRRCEDDRGPSLPSAVQTPGSSARSSTGSPP